MAEPADAPAEPAAPPVVSELDRLRGENKRLESENGELQLEVASLKEQVDEFINEDEEDMYETGDVDVGDHVNTRRRKMTWDLFKEDHDRLVRSLKRSFETETRILGHCRRLKDNLVEKAVQLRAALHQKQIDNETIATLRDQAERATNEANGLKEKERTTIGLLAILRKEITELKKRVAKQEAHLMNVPRELERLGKGSKGSSKTKRSSRDGEPDDGSSLTSAAHSPSDGAASPVAARPLGGVSFRAEAAKSAQRLSSPLRSKTAPREPGLVKLTPFMRWKQNNAVITPNTPTASPHFFSTYGFDPVGKTAPKLISTANAKLQTPMMKALRRQQRDPVDL
jgi:hypothetical protein